MAPKAQQEPQSRDILKRERRLTLGDMLISIRGHIVDTIHISPVPDEWQIVRLEVFFLMFAEFCSVQEFD